MNDDDGLLLAALGIRVIEALIIDSALPLDRQERVACHVLGMATRPRPASAR